MGHKHPEAAQVVQCIGAITQVTLGTPSGRVQSEGCHKPSACAGAKSKAGHPWPAA